MEGALASREQDRQQPVLDPDVGGDPVGIVVAADLEPLDRDAREPAERDLADIHRRGRARHELLLHQAAGEPERREERRKHRSQQQAERDEDRENAQDAGSGTGFRFSHAASPVGPGKVR
jgi:hypothetical protein